MRIINDLKYYAPVKENRVTSISFNLRKYDDNKYCWEHHTFSSKVTFQTIKSFILNYIDNETQFNIKSKFEWRGMQVWLSIENQINYKTNYDLAIQTGSANLPITFKFGTTDNPIYYTFNILDDLRDFYSKMVAHIHEQQTLGWKKKDNINWNDYKVDGNTN